MIENIETGTAKAIRFREAVAQDRARLIALVNSAFSVETFLGGTRTDEARLTATMARGSILVAEDGGGRLLASAHIERRGRRGYLGMLAVDPAQQGKGLARRLVEQAEDRLRAQGCEVVDITVLNMRPELLPIYRRFGYVETGAEEFKTPQMLKPGVKCHGIVMSKRL